VSIVRVGLAETRNFAEGYDAIFGKKRDTKGTAAGTAKATKKAAAAKVRTTKKKKITKKK
jgi:hypothetical protein